MGIYLYQNKETGEIREIFQGMNEVHSYSGQSNNETDWVRVFTNPGISFDNKIDPYSPTAFVDKTQNKKGTLGDLWDASRELSEKRKDSLGTDPIRQTAYDDYAKARNGKRHPKEKIETLKKNLSDKGFSLED